MQNGADIFTAYALAGAALAFAFLLALFGIRCFAIVANALARLPRSRLAAFLFFAAVATLCAQKQGGTNSPPDGASSHLPPRPVLPCSGNDGFAVTNFTFTAISVGTNGVSLSLAWPTNMFAKGALLDFFAKVGSLTNDWRWIGCETVAAGETNLNVYVLSDDFAPASTNMPSAAFFRVSDRTTSAATMADSDGDGLPDIYELANGTNPYVPDYALAPKLTVGTDGDYASIPAALAASTNYSIVSLASGEYALNRSIEMPAHPVMLSGPPDGYAVLKSSASIGAVILDKGNDCETLFSNLQVVLAAESSFQAGFWVGGNLPWEGIAASPTFRNIRVRALYPDVLYFGWHYYLDDGGVSEISDCIVNAASATWITGIHSHGGPEVSMSNCHFVNFSPTNECIATCFRDGTNIVAEAAGPEPGLSWAGYPLDGQYSTVLDSDGDGISDYGEIFVHDTDPWLSDSDGDGISDGVEVFDGTNPQDFTSFLRHATVLCQNGDSLSGVTNYIAWGVSDAGWETNGVVAVYDSQSSNMFTIATQSGAVYIKAFRDMNRNGTYDPGADILLCKALPQKDAVSSTTFRFGDIDGDGFPDALELAEGTDPTDAKNYCFNLSIVETNIVRITENLSAAVVFGGAIVYGPVTATNGFLEADIGHLVATNAERVVIRFWDDANTNGVFDLEELSIERDIATSGHENAVTNDFNVGLLDSDRDGMPDWWEQLHSAAGLSPYNASDARHDPDGDGLINLYEYLLNYNPGLSDGTNEAPAIISSSIDNRLASATNATLSLPLYADYYVNGTNGVFLKNEHCWAGDLDFSCMSVWNDSDKPHTYTATVISRRHVLFSTHWHLGVGRQMSFLGTNGVVYARHISSVKDVVNDISVALLNEELPPAVSDVAVLSSNAYQRILSGRHLPFVCINQDKNLLVNEIYYISYPENAEVDLFHTQPSTTRRREYYQRLRGWDSSGPSYFVFGDKLVLIGLHWTADSDSSIARACAKIQENMNFLCPGYHLKVDDLSDDEGGDE